jgi:hypothetical protein
MAMEPGSEQNEPRKKTLDERLDAMAQTLELEISLEADARRRQDEAIRRQDEAIRRQDEAIGRHEEAIGRHEEAIRLHDREMAQIRATLNRAVRLSVQEARAERKKRREWVQRQQELAEQAAKRHQELAELSDKRHRELEALLKAFLERRGNGSH